MTPSEALRLSRAETLMHRHSSRMIVSTIEGKDMAFDTFTADQIADLIDEATAAKDATIAELRAGRLAGFVSVDGGGRGLFAEMPAAMAGGPPRDWQPVLFLHAQQR